MIDEEIIKANMVFAVRLQNINSISKVIPPLGKMFVIITLAPKETPRQCTYCGKWIHKRKNWAKRLRYFYCNSPKHTTATFTCSEEECADENTLNCPHSPKCIVYRGPHPSKNSNCSLRSLFSKAKRIVNRPDKKEISCKRGQQKVFKTRMVKYKRFQRNVGIESKNKTLLQDPNVNILGAPHSLNKA